ncbi:MAG: hypothetical protein DMH00_11670 [Acidobacteria bacterium]|nr:MAG: hypothetical protein DMH00_11670 [Acidobacteriota bacterium]
MKRLAMLVCAFFVTAVMVAPLTALLAAEKTHDLKGEVVSVDLQGKMLTFKTETGESKTSPVMGKALDALKTLKAGDKVILTCTDTETGEHQGISAIKIAKEPGK